MGLLSKKQEGFGPKRKPISEMHSAHLGFDVTAGKGGGMGRKLPGGGEIFICRCFELSRCVRGPAMRPIRLPEPPSGFSGLPEIFDGGVYGAIRRAVVIGNGFAGAENQSIGLVRALGLSNRHYLYVSF